MIDVIPDRIPPGGVEIPLLGQREGRDHTGPSLRQTGAKVYGTERGTHQLGQQGAQFLVITASQIRLRHEADADATVGKIREEAVTILDWNEPSWSFSTQHARSSFKARPAASTTSSQPSCSAASSSASDTPLHPWNSPAFQEGADEETSCVPTADDTPSSSRSTVS